MAVGIWNSGTPHDRSLVHIESRARFIYDVHPVPPRQQWTGDGMPKLGQILPYVLPVRERQTVVLVGHPGSHWWSGSQRECQTDL